MQITEIYKPERLQSATYAPYDYCGENAAYYAADKAYYGLVGTGVRGKFVGQESAEYLTEKKGKSIDGDSYEEHQSDGNERIGIHVIDVRRHRAQHAAIKYAEK